MNAVDYTFLKKFSLFSNMNDKHLAEIYSLLDEKHYTSGKTLFFQGEEGNSVYFLAKGKIKALKSNAAGEEQILEILQVGDTFGEVVLFGVHEYPATTIAMEDIVVFSLSSKRFKNYFQKNSEIAWGMLQVMAEKLKSAQRRIEDLGLRNTKSRVAVLLIDLLYRFGDSKNVLVLELNRQDMADFIGTTRETVSRTISEFKNEGLIEINANKIIIKDLAGLKKWI